MSNFVRLAAWIDEQVHLAQLDFSAMQASVDERIRRGTWSDDDIDVLRNKRVRLHTLLEVKIELDRARK